MGKERGEIVAAVVEFVDSRVRESDSKGIDLDIAARVRKMTEDNLAEGRRPFVIRQSKNPGAGNWQVEDTFGVMEEGGSRPGASGVLIYLKTDSRADLRDGDIVFARRDGQIDGKLFRLR
ncbi:MAG: hypothetical protein WC686_00960 [Candidatus Shapirobacteria bacterium]|jgi:hypothetical protein